MRVAVAFLFIFLALVVEDAYGKKHQTKNVKNEQEVEDYEEDEEWPQPEAVRSFSVPDAFTGHTHYTPAAELSSPSSGKHHHQKSSQKKLTTHHY